MEQLLLERKRKLSMANVKRKYESQAKKGLNEKVNSTF